MKVIFNDVSYASAPYRIKIYHTFKGKTGGGGRGELVWVLWVAECNGRQGKKTICSTNFKLLCQVKKKDQ
jgi:hypothetical protein